MWWTQNCHSGRATLTKVETPEAQSRQMVVGLVKRERSVDVADLTMPVERELSRL